MKQRAFERIHGELWTRCEGALDGDSPDARFLPSLHRRLCQSLALARSRGYAPSLTDRLHRLARTTHGRLYGTRGDAPAQLREWVAGGFPARVRQEAPTVLLALACFWGIALVVGLLVHLRPELAESFLSHDEIEAMRGMYRSDNFRLGRQGEQGDFMMFGFYIWNNVSILFRTFATGIFLGIPSLLAIGFNGMQLGVVAAVLSADPETRLNFWSFVATHSAPEITGLVLGAASGMRLGWAALAPGRLTRSESFRRAAGGTLPVVAGSTLLVAGAAFIEAFWSANSAVPSEVRLAVGVAAWCALAAYLLLGGRHHAP